MCALCKEPEVELRESHIIPKFAYRRIKTFSTSRFRNYYDLKTIYQDGEKKPLLCQKCESFFSAFETKFANKYFDKYLSTRKLPVPYSDIKNYIISVAWRVLYDDIYVRSSPPETSAPDSRVKFEKLMRQYLGSIRQGTSGSLDVQIKCYIFSLKDLGYDKREIDFLDQSIFGYSLTSGDRSKVIVFTQYSGLVLATVYRPNNVIVLGKGLFAYFKDKYAKSGIKKILADEIDWQIGRLLDQEKINDALLDAGLREKIAARYANQEKLR